jgi:limonene-1,2-epoxide hydrolase
LNSENSESFTLTIANPSGNATIANATAGGIILNDDGGVNVQIIDDTDVQGQFTTVGGWGSWNQAGYSGDYRFSGAGTGNTATWTFQVEPGTYRIAGTWIAQYNHATNTPLTIFDGSAQVGGLTINQRSAPNDFTEGNANWENLGVYTVTGTTLSITMSNNADSAVIADAMRVERIGDYQIVDNGSSGFTTSGSWGAWNQAGFAGDYQFTTPGTGNTATWKFQVEPGTYRIAGTWIAQSNHATNTPLTIFDGSTQISSLKVNQSLAPNDFAENGANWKNLGVFSVTGNTLRITMSNDANNAVIADAFRVERVGDYQIVDNGSSGFTSSGGWGAWNRAGFAGDYQFTTPGKGNTATWTFQVEPGTYRIAGTWIAQSNHATNTPLTIFDGSAPIGNLTINQR